MKSDFLICVVASHPDIVLPGFMPGPKPSDVTFSVTRSFNGQDFTLKYAGKVAGDELKLKVSFNENEFEILAKRQATP